MKNELWTRHGECNGCGWCCQFLGQRVGYQVPLRPDSDVRFLELRGFTLNQRAGHATVPARMWIQATCAEHDQAASQCRIYTSRPKSCQAFPQLPDQIIGTDCSYWFERETPDGREVIGGRGAPPPFDGHRVLSRRSVP